MSIEKTQESRVMIGVKESTKAAFDDLAKEINERNASTHGDKAVKITHDDIIMELVRAYRKVGV